MNLATAGAVAFVGIPLVVVILYVGVLSFNGVRSGIEALQGPTLHERAITAAVEERDAILVDLPQPERSLVQSAGPPPNCSWLRGCHHGQDGPIEGFDYDNQPTAFTTFEYRPETLADLDTLRADLDRQLEATGYSTVCQFPHSFRTTRDITSTVFTRSKNTIVVIVEQDNSLDQLNLGVRLVSTAEEQRALETPEHTLNPERSCR